MNPLTNIRNITKLSEQELTKGWKTSWHDQYKDSAWVFIGGLPFDLSEGDIITVFSQYGEIATVNLVRDKDTGKSRGFCFLCYEDQRSTILAVDNFNGMKLLKRTIRVDHVQDYKPPKAPKKKPVENGEQPSDIPSQGILPPVKLEPCVTEPRVVQDVKGKGKTEEENVKHSKKVKKSKKKSKKHQENNSSDSGEEMERKKRCKKKQKQASSSSSSSSETSSSDSSESSSSSSSSSSEDDKSKSKKYKKQKKRSRSSSSDSSSGSEDDKKSKHKKKKKNKKQKHSPDHGKKSDKKTLKSSKIPEESKSDDHTKSLTEIKIKQEVISDDDAVGREKFQKNEQSDHTRGMSRWDHRNPREGHSGSTKEIERETYKYQQDNTSNGLNNKKVLASFGGKVRQSDNYRKESRRQQSTSSDRKPYDLNDRSSKDHRNVEDRYDRRREDPGFRQANRDFGEKRERRRERCVSVERKNISKEGQCSPSYEKSKLKTKDRDSNRSRSIERKRDRSASPYRRRGPDKYRH